MTAYSRIQAKIEEFQTHIWDPQLVIGACSIEPVELDDRTIEGLVSKGIRLYFNPDFVMKLDDEQLTGLIAHVALHCYHQRYSKIS